MGIEMFGGCYFCRYAELLFFYPSGCCVNAGGQSIIHTVI